MHSKHKALQANRAKERRKNLAKLLVFFSYFGGNAVAPQKFERR